ncbi:O-antigen ligase family protein [Oceanicoccus sagamiensis]|uniref:O-antigen ligase-related domain-containing protein n=1 Tax=Oceanicoccus sagamiensis TaxID=716816 RepID=A0A1X9N7P3_9GAMM|nr:O-antigen ligase family protein [Oceanicoccus sagamiensis]ARN74088.1 hypothetical protein BST96_08110 [Oceanicoccus sagamiensis]
MTIQLFLAIFFIDIILEAGIDFPSKIGPISFKNAFIYSMLIWAIVNKSKEAGIRRDKSVEQITLWFIIFGSYAILSASFPMLMGRSDYPAMLALNTIKNEVLDAFSCFFIFWFFTKNSRRPMLGLKISVVFIGLMCAATLLESIIGGLTIFDFDDDSARPNGPMGEPNQTATILALCLPIVASMVLFKGFIRLIALGVCFLILVTIALTGSRGGMLSAFVACSHMFWLMRSNIALSNRVLILAAAPVVMFFAWFIMPEYYQSLLLERLSFFQEKDVDWDTASAGRTIIWGRGIDLWYQSPIIGSGWSSFKLTLGGASHNVYLEYLVSLGIVGVIIVLLMYRKLYFHFMKFRKLFIRSEESLLAAGAASGIVGLCAGLFFVNLYVPWLIVWCMLGYVAGIKTKQLIEYRVNQITLQQAQQAQQAPEAVK